VVLQFVEDSLEVAVKIKIPSLHLNRPGLDPRNLFNRYSSAGFARTTF
jgi:hypothetical protein